ESLGGSRPGWQQGLFSSAGLIEVIDSAVVGVAVWLAVEAAKPVPWLPVVLGVLGFLSSLVAHHAYQGRRFKRFREAIPPMFPTPLPVPGRGTQTYVPVSSGWSGSP